MHFGNSAIPQATGYRTGVLVALAGNLMWSGSLWLLMYRAGDILADYYVWVAATAAVFVVTLIAGVALQRLGSREEVGDGVLRGSAILAVLFVLWHSCASAYFAD